MSRAQRAIPVVELSPQRMITLIRPPVVINHAHPRRRASVLVSALLARVSSAHAASRSMQDPLLESQTAILVRVVSNVEKLNEAMRELNRALGVRLPCLAGLTERKVTSAQEINEHNANIVRVTDLWSHYNRNVSLFPFYLAR